MFITPDLHDGFFDGVWLSQDNCVCVFVRTDNGERSTIVLRDVEALHISNMQAGNIILDAVLIEPQKLTLENIKGVYQYQLQAAEDAKAVALLEKARQRQLSLLEINASYGAECTFLFGSVDSLPNHVIPTLAST